MIMRFISIFIIFMATFGLFLSCQEEEVFMPQVTRIELSTDKTSLVADGQDQITLSAQVFDQNDGHMNGVDVTYFASGQALQGNIFTTNSPETFELEARADGVTSNTVEVGAEPQVIDFEITSGAYYPFQIAELIFNEKMDFDEIDTVYVGSEITSLLESDSSSIALVVPYLTEGEYEVKFFYDQRLFISKLTVQNHQFEEGENKYLDLWFSTRNDIINNQLDSVEILSSSAKSQIKIKWSEAEEAFSRFDETERVSLASLLKTMDLLSADTNVNSRISQEPNSSVNQWSCTRVFITLGALSGTAGGLTWLALTAKNPILQTKALGAILAIGSFVGILRTINKGRNCISEANILERIENLIDTNARVKSTTVESGKAYSLEAKGVYRQILEGDRSRIENSDVQFAYQVIDQVEEFWNDFKELDILPGQEEFNFFPPVAQQRELSIPNELISFSSSTSEVEVKQTNIGNTEVSLEFSTSSDKDIEFDLEIDYKSIFITERYAFLVRMKAAPSLILEKHGSLDEPITGTIDEPLNLSVSVKKEEDKSPFKGKEVVWNIIEGTAQLSVATSQTDENGVATIQVTSAQEGIIKVEASLAGKNDKVVFEIENKAREDLYDLTKVRPIVDTVITEFNQTVLEVLLSSKINSSPVGEENINWRITEGLGELSSSSTLTNSRNGVTTNIFTLNSEGISRIIASSTKSDDEVEFIVKRAEPIDVNFEYISGSQQLLGGDEAKTFECSFRVVDEGGNPLSGFKVDIGGSLDRSPIPIGIKTSNIDGIINFSFNKPAKFAITGSVSIDALPYKGKPIRVRERAVFVFYSLWASASVQANLGGCGETGDRAINHDGGNTSVSAGSVSATAFLGNVGCIESTTSYASGSLEGITQLPYSISWGVGENISATGSISFNGRVVAVGRSSPSNRSGSETGFITIPVVNQ